MKKDQDIYRDISARAFGNHFLNIKLCRRHGSRTDKTINCASLFLMKHFQTHALDRIQETNLKSFFYIFRSVAVTSSSQIGNTAETKKKRCFLIYYVNRCNHEAYSSKIFNVQIVSDVCKTHGYINLLTVESFEHRMESLICVVFISKNNDTFQ